MRKLSPVLIALAGILMIAGCAVEGGQSVSSSNSVTALSYLPVESGYQAFYEVTYSDGRSEVVRFSVGAETQLGSESANEWIYTPSVGDERVSFIQAKNDCILIYDPSSSTTEKILQLPLEPGASWVRYSSGSDVIDDGDGGFFDFEGANDDTSIAPGDANGEEPSVNETNKGHVDDDALGAYPTEGDLQMLVEEIESIELKSGRVYTNAIRVSNAGSSGRMNYYWYVQGAGLVKYAINAHGPDDGSGQIVGELVSFSR